MSNLKKTDIWISHFNKYESFQDYNKDEFDEIRESFKEDYCNLYENDKEKLWNLFLARKRFRVRNNGNYNILFEMYNEDKLSNYENLSDEQIDMINNIDQDISDLELPDFNILFTTAPFIMLERILESFRVYCWKEFNKLNIGNLNNESKRNTLDGSMIFGKLMDIYQLNDLLDLNEKEQFFDMHLTSIVKYIKSYAKELKNSILKKIEISHDYLFCPEIVSSIMPLATDDEKSNISKNVVDTHLKLIELKSQGFVIPKIFNTNILLLKNIS